MAISVYYGMLWAYANVPCALSTAVPYLIQCAHYELSFDAKVINIGPSGAVQTVLSKAP